MKIVSHDQRTSAWLEWRKGGVTASEAAVIMGISPYMTEWRLYAEKCGLALPEDLSRNPYVRHGIEYEDVARRAFEARHPGEIAIPLCGESIEHPFMRASFDGVISKRRPAELKCPCRSVFEKIKSEQRNSEGYQLYWAQVQHQMAVSGASEGYLFFWYFDEEPVEFLIQRDDEFIRELTEKARVFARRVVTRTPPERDPKRDVMIPKGAKAKSWINASEQVKTYAAQIDELEEQLTKLKDAKKKAETGIKALMGDFYTAEYDGVRVARFFRAGKVNYEALLRKHFPEGLDLIDAYRNESIEQFRITVTDKELPDWNADEDFDREIERIKSERAASLYW